MPQAGQKKPAPSPAGSAFVYDYLLYTARRSWEPKEIHLSAFRPGKGAASRRTSPARFSPELPKNLADINEALLQAILMINEIVTSVVRNIWYYAGKSIAE